MRLTKFSVWGGALFTSGLALSAQAGQVTLQIEVPQQTVAEYHKPYVAGWLEDASGNSAGTVFVWYDIRKANDAGQKWLNHLRTWWRKAGRDFTLPADGVTGATRAPGRQTLTLDKSAFDGLKPGTYNLVVEAARESGGHDLVRVPFTLKPGQGAQGTARGDGELGAIMVSYKP